MVLGTLIGTADLNVLRERLMGKLVSKHDSSKVESELGARYLQ